jgi:uncharacterized protein
MKIPEQGKLLRIFIGESDKSGHLPLYEAIVKLAKEKGLAGATVFKGVQGFGANSRVHTNKILRLSEDLPMVIEIVDDEQKIDAFIPLLDGMIQEGLVTVEKAQVILYRFNKEKKDAG